MSDEALRAVIAKWRETATIWEDQELGRGKYYGSPVGNGKGNIQNWINWLRWCAKEVEAAMESPQSEAGGLRKELETHP